MLNAKVLDKVPEMTGPSEEVSSYTVAPLVDGKWVKLLTDGVKLLVDGEWVKLVVDVANVTFNEPTSKGELIVAGVVIETAQGKEYLDPIDPTGTLSDKDDDTAAPEIIESIGGWYRGTDPQDDGEAMGDGLDEKDEYDYVDDEDVDDEDDEYDGAVEVSGDMFSHKPRHPEHCPHCVLKEPVLAHEVVKNRMEHRGELIISLRTTLREVLAHKGLDDKLRNTLYALATDNALWRVKALKVNEILDEAYFLSGTRPIGSYDVIQIDDIGLGIYWRIGIWTSDTKGKQTLVTCEGNNGPIAGDRYTSYEIVRHAVGVLNDSVELPGGKDEE